MRLYILTTRRRRYPMSPSRTIFALSDGLARQTVHSSGRTKVCCSRKPSQSPLIISLQVLHCASRTNAPLRRTLQGSSRRSSRRPQGRRALGQAEDCSLLPPERRRQGRQRGPHQRALWRPRRGLRTRTSMHIMEELAPRSEIEREYHEWLLLSTKVSQFRE